MKHFKAFAAITLVCFVGLARATITGNELYAQIKSDGTTDVLKAYAYIEGVLDTEDLYLTMAVFEGIDSKGSKQARFRVPHICWGDNKVTLGQIKDIVQKYLEAHPEKRHYTANVLVRLALLEVFACANNPLMGERK